MVTYTRPFLIVTLCELFLINDNIVAAPVATHQVCVMCQV